ncbi:MAG: ribosomal L7Ae/L30e/S12e/Gadd45 family protein [Syntrophomonadaceae bacterium]|nr:ribosomal L7Ae/L30e/S12e/Gadd45 family protein [Syntrophomonadaceae bacterium]
MKKIFAMIGMAQKAGKVSAGAVAAKNSIVRKRACLLIMSNDISSATKESLQSNCEKLGIPCITVGDKFELGTAVGKAYRVAVTINDKGFAGAILNQSESVGIRIESTGVVQWPK